MTHSWLWLITLSAKQLPKPLNMLSTFKLQILRSQSCACLQAQSRLPPSMLFSDRDFTADDYEALLALDEGIDNRKGAC
jgi:hypothetical protein